jgi:hypothetical protein
LTKAAIRAAGAISSTATHLMVKEPRCSMLEHNQSVILQKLTDGGDTTVSETAPWPAALREALRILVWNLYVVMRDERYEITPEGIFELRRLKRLR